MPPTISPSMIYCVIPRELADDLYDKMVEYYKDNPNVSVIIDRRDSHERRNKREGGGLREVRDRRRARIPGTFPETEATEAS
jgi:hypothetical protein